MSPLVIRHVILVSTIHTNTSTLTDLQFAVRLSQRDTLIHRNGLSSFSSTMSTCRRVGYGGLEFSNPREKKLSLLFGVTIVQF